MAIPSSLVHHGEQLFFLAPRAGDLACATFLLVGTNLPFMGAVESAGWCQNILEFLFVGDWS